MLAQDVYRTVQVFVAVVVLVFLIVTGINRLHRKLYPTAPTGQRFKALPIALIAGVVIVIWALIGLFVLYATN
jgi:multisubunit Na+/H+ antiporter MnhB subunit